MTPCTVIETKVLSDMLFQSLEFILKRNKVFSSGAF